MKSKEIEILESFTFLWISLKDEFTRLEVVAYSHLLSSALPVVIALYRFIIAFRETTGNKPLQRTNFTRASCDKPS